MRDHSGHAKRGGLVKGVVFACTISAIVLGAASAKAEVCANSTARKALEMRVLQSELMVSALTCGQKSNYNAFVTTFKPHLKKQGSELRAFFSEFYGPKAGPQKLNRIVTRLANMASQDSLSGTTQAYCDAAAARFAQVLSSSPKGLSQMARENPNAKAHGYKACVETANRTLAESGATPAQGVN